jgi:DNA-binding FadR family transcriptional regulator
MTEAGMMRLAIKNHDAADLEELENRLRAMENTLCGTDETSVKAFFEADDRFHDMIAVMGKNPMADKINRIVRSLTYDLRYKTVSEMIASGRTEELIEAHRRLLEAIREGNLHNVSDKVRGSYYEEVVLEKRQ